MEKHDNLHSSMDRLETFHLSTLFALDCYLHSSMDRLETASSHMACVVPVIFTFQYG